MRLSAATRPDDVEQPVACAFRERTCGMARGGIAGIGRKPCRSLFQIERACRYLLCEVVRQFRISPHFQMERWVKALPKHLVNTRGITRRKVRAESIVRDVDGKRFSINADRRQMLRPPIRDFSTKRLAQLVENTIQYKTLCVLHVHHLFLRQLPYEC